MSNHNPSSAEAKSQNALQEEKILEFWREQNVFQKTVEKNSPISLEATQDKKEFVFFEGPPTANGRPGIHHVLARSFKDIIPRYKTMRGFHVRRKAGWDTHGLPVELQVEKQLGLKSKKEIEEFGVAEFNKRSRASVWEYKDEWEKLTERMGYWLDMHHPYVTYDNSYIEALWGTVKKISERTTADGRPLLYRDFRVGPWCARCGTGLSSHELNQPGAYKDVKDLSVFAKFKLHPNQTIGNFVTDDNTYIIAWTTTPWTLPGNVALAVGSDIEYVVKKQGDEKIIGAIDFIYLNSEEKEPEEVHKNILQNIKGSDLVGLTYEPLYPFMQHLVKDQDEAMVKAYQVYAADFVTTTDGTGIVHTAVMYGADDFELGTKIGLPKFHLVNEEGKFIAGCDTETLKLSGRFVKEKSDGSDGLKAGEETLAIDIIKDLAGRGLLFKKEKYEHSYPHCWRCDTPLIYYARTSWYFRMSALREQMLEANKTINWEPDHIRDGRFGEWLDGIKDWAISRDRYWGTPLPVWVTASGKQQVIGGLADLKKCIKKSGNTYFAMRHGHGEHIVQNVAACDLNDTFHLTEQGKQSARETAKVLQEKKITKIFASPLIRCRETAQIVADVIGIPQSEIIYDDRIREYDFGDFCGKSFDEFLALRNGGIKNYSDQLGGTSMQDVKKRIGDFLKDLELNYSNETILIVSHGVFFETANAVVEGADDARSLEILQTMGKVHTAEFREIPFQLLPYNEQYELDLHKPYIDTIELIHPETGEPMTRTPEVIDVWFDSGAMPMAQDHKLGEPVNFDPVPADYISEGVDQTRGWFYTMHAIANLLHDNPTQAYKNVVCLGLVLDANGQKMSKSRGNVVNPWDMFDKYGADVVRFWFYSVNQPGEFKNFDEKSLDEVSKKVFNPLRNIVSFYEMYVDAFKDFNRKESGSLLDKWITSLWNQTLEKVITGMEQYQVLEPSRAIREFINEFSTWYIRRSRDRFKTKDPVEDIMALVTTRNILCELAKTMAPFTPFLSEEIWQKFGNSESVHLESYPIAKSYDEKILRDMEQIRELITLGLDARQKANIKVRQPLASITISDMNLDNEYLEIIKDELNVKQVIVDPNFTKDQLVLDTSITQELQDEGEMRELVRKIQDMRKQADLVPSDRVSVILQNKEPHWFTMYQQEILETVGAHMIMWGGDKDGVDKV